MHVVMAGGTGEEPGCMEKVLQLANDLTKHADIQRISRRFTAATTRSRDISPKPYRSYRHIDLENSQACNFQLASEVSH